jgi:glycine/D-amino acid oxidase-like deaminating enzyme
LIKQHGKQKIKAYAEANEAAIKKIDEIIKAEKIKCDWNRSAHYVYTSINNEMGRFKAEAKAAKSLGLPASFETKTPLPFAIKAAVKFDNQASFNSQKYLNGLARAVNGGGSHVFEKSQAKVIREGSPAIVRTDKATIEAKDIIVATHVPTFPLVARGSYGFLEYPTESFLISAEIKYSLKGMYISPDNDHYSILPIKIDGKNMILIGGEGGNIPGIRLSKKKRYQRLANCAIEHFGATKITNKWSDMDYMGYDNLPLVGKLYPWSRHRYTGTGYMKWGLTNGTAAAMILRDLIMDEPNPWQKVFDSTRLSPIKYIPKAVIRQITG